MKHWRGLNRRRMCSAALAGLLSVSCALPVSAVGDGVMPTYDEAYYATMDYYGNLTEGSIVKSYIVNGAASLTDYGTYDEVTNLTDGRVPVRKDGATTFSFDGDAPSHFYFEGKTAQPFENLPWTIGLSYTLNGVAAKAEDLAGKTGVVEINIDLVPNEKASAYARHNYTLEAMAMFNQDDILSLEAEGAQVQLVGNLRAVLFIALPGGEEHFTIRVGTDDFSFGGMTFLMVPATLSQLSEIAKLSQRKEDLEDDYDKLSDSLDALLDALASMEGNLYATANGLDELNAARGAVSAGKGQVYDDADVLRGDLDALVEAIKPVSTDFETPSQALTDAKEVLHSITTDVAGLRGNLDTLRDDLDALRSNKRSIKQVLDDLVNMQEDLRDLRDALYDASNIRISRIKSPSGSRSSAYLGASLSQAKQLNTLYTSTASTADAMKVGEFMAAALLAGDSSLTAAEAAVSAAALYAALSDTTSPYYTQAAALQGAFNLADTAGIDTKDSSLTFAEFLYAILLASGNYDIATASGLAQAQKDAASLYQLYTLYDGNQTLVDDLLSDVNSASSDISGTVSNVNSSISKINNLLDDLAGPAGDVVDYLADMCEDVDNLKALVDDGDDLVGEGSALIDKIPPILDDIEALQAVLDVYEPKAQQALVDAEEAVEEVNVLTAALSGTLSDTGTFYDSLKPLLQTSGERLDSGTRKSLSELAATLRQTACAMAATGGVKAAKDTITEIIEDTWDEHTGDIDNLLLMDAGAQRESLTDSRNPAPTSVQVLIRTQEIKAEDEEAGEEITKTEAERTTFLGRIKAMFVDLWNMITGFFRH